MPHLTATAVFVPSAGVVWPFEFAPANRAAWQEVLDTPGARLVTYEGYFATAHETAAIAALFLFGIEADAHGVYRIQPEGLLGEHDVKELLRAATANRQSAAFARSAGVSKVLVGQILRGDRRPGTAVLDALGLQRIRGTRTYMRKIPGAAEFGSDARGGLGGTVGKIRIAA